MSLRSGLNPRFHIAAAIGWAVFGVVTLAALLTAGLAAEQAEQRARADVQGLLAEFATQVRDAVSMNLETRRSLLQALATQLAAMSDQDRVEQRRILVAAQAQSPEFVWLGITGPAGKVEVATGDGLKDADASALPWFREGRLHPFVSDVHASPAQAQSHPSEPLIDMAVPLPGGGTLTAFLSWSWVEQQVSKMQQALSRNRRLELMLTARDGAMLIGPPNWTGRRLAADVDATEDGRYVVGTRSQLRLADGLGLGWTAIVRQPAELALAPARATRRTVFLVVFMAGLLAAAAAAAVTRWLTRRLTRLASEAEAVRRGERRSLAAPAGADEVSRIGATLAHLVDHLQAEKQALQTLNVELDQRVAERTQRIEVMADEARHAAVARERLRIARDLHDTLAHSLMALLTQIRLVRKLHSRMDAAALDEELGRAESVTLTGLADARAAIAQMRDNGVRDTGLGPALQDLVRRFTERTGVAASLVTSDQPSRATGESAEIAFRIVEEALRNVERHALAQRVRIGLAVTPPTGAASRIRVEVADDGIGFDPALPRPGHYGLRGAQEQAALIGANLQVRSSPGQGTCIQLEFDT